MQVARISPSDGLPATSIVVTVVSSSSSWTFGFVSAKRSAASCRTPVAGSPAVVARDASMAGRAYRLVLVSGVTGQAAGLARGRALLARRWVRPGPDPGGEVP